MNATQSKPMPDKQLLIDATSLESVIDRNPTLVTPGTLVTELIERIQELGFLESNNSSDTDRLKKSHPMASAYCLVVSPLFLQVHQSQDLSDPYETLPKKSEILGIVSIQDIVRLNLASQSLNDLSIAEIMNCQLITIKPSEIQDIFTVVSLWQQYGITPLLLCDSEEQLLGVMTPERILPSLKSKATLESNPDELQQIKTELQAEKVKNQNLEMALQSVQQYLQKQVEERTADLKKANEILKQDIIRQQEVETALRISESEYRKQAKRLEQALDKLQKTQAKLIQMEKMSGLGQLVAGIAHEINNPINFIYGNITHATSYIEDMIELLELYQTNYPNPVEEIQEIIEEIELDFLMTDLPKLLHSMQSGSERIRHIVQSLRNFSRLDEAAVKEVDIHEGIESTLLILQHRFKGKLGKPNIEICKHYGNLPKVECYPSLLNQVFMNLLNNALDALENESPPQVITIKTRVCTVDSCQLEEDPDLPFSSSYVRISIADNGRGMDPKLQQRIFEPFFTTKPVGKGTGLGLSISYQVVVEKHSGKLEVISAPGEGTELRIEIPIKQPNNQEPPLFKDATLNQIMDPEQ
jgi:two-component system NtrC family sensor kinase